MEALSKRESFQAGFWDGLEGRESEQPTAFGWVETDFGSVRPDNIRIYDRGFAYGRQFMLETERVFLTLGKSTWMYTVFMESGNDGMYERFEVDAASLALAARQVAEQSNYVGTRSFLVFATNGAPYSVTGSNAIVYEAKENLQSPDPVE